jgi:hypothetical protein
VKEEIVTGRLFTITALCRKAVFILFAAFFSQKVFQNLYFVLVFFSFFSFWHSTKKKNITQSVKHARA